MCATSSGGVTCVCMSPVVTMPTQRRLAFWNVRTKDMGTLEYRRFVQYVHDVRLGPAPYSLSCCWGSCLWHSTLVFVVVLSWNNVHRCRETSFTSRCCRQRFRTVIEPHAQLTKAALVLVGYLAYRWLVHTPPGAHTHTHTHTYRHTPPVERLVLFYVVTRIVPMCVLGLV